MSFLRPGAAATLRRWGEPAGVGVALFLCVWQGVAWLAAGSILAWLALPVAFLLTLWLRSALASALARGGRDGPGVVVYREGEVGYLGPHAGGFVDLAALEAVEIVGDGTRAVGWRLEASDGRVLAFPADATGADRLVEVLAALPGFSDLGVARALGTPGRTVVWRRTLGPGLAGPAPR